MSKTEEEIQGLRERLWDIARAVAHEPERRENEAINEVLSEIEALLTASNREAVKRFADILLEQKKTPDFRPTYDYIPVSAITEVLKEGE